MTSPDHPTTGFQFSHPSSGEGWFAGLTKREYFAAMAMQGMMSYGFDDDNFWPFADIPKNAVIMADNLIEALNKGK